MEYIRNYEKIILSSVDSIVQILASKVHNYVEDLKVEMVGKKLKTFDFNQGSIDLKVEITEDGTNKFFLLLKSKSGPLKRVDFDSSVKLSVLKDGEYTINFSEDLISFDDEEKCVAIQIKEISNHFNSLTYVQEKLPNTHIYLPLTNILENIQNNPILHSECVQKYINDWCNKIIEDYKTFIINYKYDTIKFYKIFIQNVDRYYDEMINSLNNSFSSEIVSQLTSFLLKQKTDLFNSMTSLDNSKIQNFLGNVDSILVNTQLKIMDLYSLIDSDIVSFFNETQGIINLRELYKISYPLPDSGNEDIRI